MRFTRSACKFTAGNVMPTNTAACSTCYANQGTCYANAGNTAMDGCVCPQTRSGANCATVHCEIQTASF